ncbi:MAG TPA: hypothetical protein VFC92_02590 [Bacteroidales bacterium]|nr:hypothetical protein [Bacteroidales bacterium]
MKNLTLSIVLAISIQAMAFSPPRLPKSQPAFGGHACQPDGIEFSTQADIENFQTIHSNCTDTEGDVINTAILRTKGKLLKSN